MPLRILDFSSSKTWIRQTRSIIKTVFSECVQAEIRKNDPEWIFEDTFKYVTKAMARCGEDIDFDGINFRLDLLYSNKFTHWRGFHACRPATLKPYQLHGIHPLTREFLIESAIETFRDFAPEEQIRDVAGSLELDGIQRARGDICLFAHSEMPIDSSCNHYLRSGSEALQALAVRLNAPYRGIMAQRGKPVIIQCAVPWGEVQQGYKLEAYRTMITQYFRNALSGGEMDLEIRDFCFRTSGAIAPACIEKFISVTESQILVGPHPAH